MKYQESISLKNGETCILRNATREDTGQAGLNAVGVREKVRHCAKFGVSVEKAYWNQGIGTALLAAGITCARQAGSGSYASGTITRHLTFNYQSPETGNTRRGKPAG